MREITTPGLNMAVAVRDADEVDLAAYAVQTGEAEPALADVPASVLAAHRRRRSLTGATTDVTAVMWSTPHTVHEEAGRRRRLEAGAEYAGPMVAFTLYDGGGDEIDVEAAEEPITLSLSLAGGKRAGDSFVSSQARFRKFQGGVFPKEKLEARYYDKDSGKVRPPPHLKSGTAPCTLTGHNSSLIPSPKPGVPCLHRSGARAA